MCISLRVFTYLYTPLQSLYVFTHLYTPLNVQPFKNVSIGCVSLPCNGAYSSIYPHYQGLKCDLLVCIPHYHRLKCDVFFYVSTLPGSEMRPILLYIHTTSAWNATYCSVYPTLPGSQYGFPTTHSSPRLPDRQCLPHESIKMSTILIITVLFIALGRRYNPYRVIFNTQLFYLILLQLFWPAEQCFRMWIWSALSSWWWTRPGTSFLLVEGNCNLNIHTSFFLVEGNCNLNIHL